jgi:hypothetical protein
MVSFAVHSLYFLLSLFQEMERVENLYMEGYFRVRIYIHVCVYLDTTLERRGKKWLVKHNIRETGEEMTGKAQH